MQMGKNKSKEITNENNQGISTCITQNLEEVINKIYYGANGKKNYYNLEGLRKHPLKKLFAYCI